MDRVNIELLVRDGCHLCEAALVATRRVVAELEALYATAQFELALTDVDSDPELLARYSDEVPVLLVNGEQRAFWRVDEEHLRAHLVQILS